MRLCISTLGVVWVALLPKELLPVLTLTIFSTHRTWFSQRNKANGPIAMVLEKPRERAMSPDRRPEPFARTLRHT
jgi:hypothetical protein